MSVPAWMWLLSPAELSDEVSRTEYEIALCTGDLRAWDLELYGGDHAVALSSLAWHEWHLAQLHTVVQRHLRARAHRNEPRYQADWDRVRYVDLIGLAQTLLAQEGRQVGKICWFVCPHGEKSGSLAVYPPGCGWYCFGCHKGGSDAVSFVAAWANQGLGCSQLEALRWVEQLCDLPGEIRHEATAGQNALPGVLGRPGEGKSPRGVAA